MNSPPLETRRVPATIRIIGELVVITGVAENERLKVRSCSPGSGLERADASAVPC
jgi:hypothetical protein